MKLIFFIGLFISVITLSDEVFTIQEQDEIDILKRKVLDDVKSNWSEFDTCFLETITLELKRNNKVSASSDSDKTRARFSYLPGFFHKFYLICSGAEGFHCSLKLYEFNEAKGLPNKLVEMTEMSGTSQGFVSFTHLLDTKNEWLLVLENSSDTEGTAFAMTTVQIPENDDFRRWIFERNREIESKKRNARRSDLYSFSTGM